MTKEERLAELEKKTALTLSDKLTLDALDAVERAFEAGKNATIADALADATAAAQKAAADNLEQAELSAYNKGYADAEQKFSETFAPKTEWEKLLKECKGDTVKARKLYPEAYNRHFSNHRI